MKTIGFSKQKIAILLFPFWIRDYASSMKPNSKIKTVLNKQEKFISKNLFPFSLWGLNIYLYLLIFTQYNKNAGESIHDNGKTTN